MAIPAAAPLDRLAALLDRFPVRAHLFHSGPLCGVSHFAAQAGRGFLHVLRKGSMELAAPAGPGGARIVVNEPSLLLYPRALTHTFHNAPADGPDFTCATLDFDGAHRHPLVRALPPQLIVPLQRIDGLDATLALLFRETDRVRCGHRLMADRLFDVVLLQVLRWLLDHPGEAGVDFGLIAGLADPALARVLTALHQQPGAPWSLEAMAATAGMSRSAFALRFKHCMEQTPADYLADWRLGIAQAQLRKGRAVKLIADELGYANASGLSRAFTQRLGMSPRTWLMQAREPATTS
ncbi:AraC family transcriptional regulator [Rugamonas sp. CCM 8940]|uniref:AraC family transcriptional regulator n=1 Tax=Rugamonas sp. CCM 8940 TaxID=2765359 RepID=UPI0018F6E792|nr:AraC family transcriptional regulator [Rugamonas sp. CCM 8940]MBJ7310032.1 AraC family transcriptional regulator [Rugamonas sp. CCM 8940]